MYALLALCGAAFWGVWQFGTGNYGRRMSIYGVILISAASAIVTYLCFGVASNNLRFDERDVAAGFSGGSLNFLGTILLLKALSMGKMGVATGVTSASVVIPLAYSVIIGEAITGIAIAGIVIILAGLILFCLPQTVGEGRGRGSSTSLTPVFLSLGAAVTWGLAIVVLDVGSRTNIFGTLTMAQMPQVAVTVVIVVAARSLSGTSRRDVGALIGSGVALGLGNLAFYAAAVEGNVGIVSVLGSLSPIATALLALLVLKERMVRAEVLALVVVIIGTGMVLF